MGDVIGHAKFPRTLPPEAQAIRAARRALGLTQEAYASRHGVTSRTVQDWEAGRAESAMARAILRDVENVRKAA